MPAVSIAERTKAKFDETVFTVDELCSRGYGHKNTVRHNLREHDIPVEILDGRGTIGVRESNLHLLPMPQRTVVAPPEYDGLANFAAQVVSTWPRLTAERKRELGRLLAT
ncbi:hypothetical protein ACWGJP_10615 [Microbacterium sp. NPDC055903]